MRLFSSLTLRHLLGILALLLAVGLVVSGQFWHLEYLPVVGLIAVLVFFYVKLGAEQPAEQINAERREYARQTALLDALPAAVVILNKQGQVFRYNDAWLRLVREAEFDMPDGGVGQHYQQVMRKLCPVTDSTTETPLEVGIRRVANDRNQRYEEDLHTIRSGAHPWFHVYVRPMLEDDACDVLLMLINISARKDLETIKERSHVLLQQSLHALALEKSALKEAERALTEAYQRETETGRVIQKTLLQGTFPARLNHVNGATHTEPSQTIDGDFFAFMQYSPDCFDVLVGDVMGKGIHAAMIGAAIKSAFSESIALLVTQKLGATTLPRPAEIINELNRQLVEQLIQLESYATLALYRVNIPEQTLQYVSAGHMPGLICRFESETIEEIHGRNLPIGIMADEVYEDDCIPLKPGDALLMFSDGITDARNAQGQEFGVARLKQLVLEAWRAGVPPSTLLQYLRRTNQHFASEYKQVDDQTLLMFQVDPWRDSRTFKFAMPSLVEFRAFLNQSLADLDQEDLDALNLAGCEAFTNIVRHSQRLLPDAEITCRIARGSDCVTIEFFYLGHPFDFNSVPEPDLSGNTEGGFGLFIIRNLVQLFTTTAPLPDVVHTSLTRQLGKNIEPILDLSDFPDISEFPEIPDTK